MNQFFYQITRKASDLINSDDYCEEEYYKADRIYKKQKIVLSCYDRFAAEFSHKNDADRA